MQLSTRAPILTLAEALWTDAEGRSAGRRRRSAEQLRVSRRPTGPGYGPRNSSRTRRTASPEPSTGRGFGGWAALADAGPPPWVREGALDLIDADGWILDAWEAVGRSPSGAIWAASYDAPRAFGLPPETAVKLAEPLGWEALPDASGASPRRWMLRSDGRAVVVTDALFSAGAGASGEIVTTVTSGQVEVVLDLPSATPRAEMRRGDRPGCYSPPVDGSPGRGDGDP